MKTCVDAELTIPYLTVIDAPWGFSHFSVVWEALHYFYLKNSCCSWIRRSRLVLPWCWILRSSATDQFLTSALGASIVFVTWGEPAVFWVGYASLYVNSWSGWSPRYLASSPWVIWYRFKVTRLAERRCFDFKKIWYRLILFHWLIFSQWSQDSQSTLENYSLLRRCHGVRIGCYFSLLLYRRLSQVQKSVANNCQKPQTNRWKFFDCFRHYHISTQRLYF